MASKDKYSAREIECINKCKAKKTARRKKRKAQNAKLREAGIKFSKKDACYKRRISV